MDTVQITCPKCGNINHHPDVQFCHKCGASLTGTASVVLSKADRREKQYRLVLNWDGKMLFRGFDLSKRDLSLFELVQADFRRANLTETKLRWAKLSKADLSKTRLGKADLSGADLTRANLSGADLRGAELHWADLSGADLSGAIITPGQLSRAKSLQGATMPNGAKHK